MGRRHLIAWAPAAVGCPPGLAAPARTQGQRLAEPTARPLRPAAPGPGPPHPPSHSVSALLAPERILRLESDRVVFLDQRKLPGEELEPNAAAPPRSQRRSARWSSGARPRSGSPPPTGSRSRLRRARSSSRPRRCSEPRGRPRSISPGRSSRCAPIPPPSMPARSTARRWRAAARCPRTRPACSAPGTRALTHCNAGGLATGGYGSAVGALLAAWERELLAHVWVDETRPLLQGGRLTAWELERAGIPHAVIADRPRQPRGWLPARSTSSSRVPTGSPPTATPRTRSAPTASRCSPTTTRSRSTSSLPARPSISHRDGRRDSDRGARPAELTARFPARNPAFDVTPAGLITAIVTEHGVHRAPYGGSLAGCGGG